MLLQLQLHSQCLQMCEQNLNRDMMYARLITVPTLATCNFLGVGHVPVSCNLTKICLVLIPVSFTSEQLFISFEMLCFLLPAECNDGDSKMKHFCTCKILYSLWQPHQCTSFTNNTHKYCTHTGYLPGNEYVKCKCEENVCCKAT
jgi:hypothetical protein